MESFKRDAKYIKPDLNSQRLLISEQFNLQKIEFFQALRFSFLQNKTQVLEFCLWEESLKIQNKNTYVIVHDNIVRF